MIGYGRVGQNLGQLLRTAQCSYVALDLDLERIAMARAAGEFVVYGEANRETLLKAAGLERAVAVAITIDHFEAVLRITKMVRRLNTHLAILVRTRDDAHLEALLDAGATEVFPESLESSLMMGTRLMQCIGVPEAEIRKQIAQIRADRYEPLRRFFHAQGRAYPIGAYQEHLNTITLGDKAHAVGRSLEELTLGDKEVAVMSVIREGIHITDPPADTKLHEGDVVVLAGQPPALNAANRHLQDGAE